MFDPHSFTVGLGFMIQTGSGEFLLPNDLRPVCRPFANQPALEYCHLQKFESLLKAQMPHLSFKLEGRGADPPDFIVRRSTERQPFGLELTTFGIPTKERQEQAWRFSVVPRALLAAYRKGRLRGLTGLRFAIWFGSPFAAPPKNIPEATLAELVTALESASTWLRPLRPEDETTLPSGEVAGGTVSWRVSGYADKANVPLRGSELADEAGFDVQHNMSQWVRPEDVVQQMNQTIAIKDRQENLELLIVAGGPTMSGKAFFAGTALVMLLMKTWSGPVVKPTHLRRVFLLDWYSQAITLLYEA